MAEFPFLPLATDAYLADTTHLTTIEHGAYLLLLIAMWRNRLRLPNDDQELARFAHLTRGQWERIRPRIIRFFDVDGDEITHGRLKDEMNYVRQHSRKQSDKANARWLKNKEVRDAAAMPERCRGNTPTPTYYSDTTVSGAEGAPPDFQKALFNEGLASLIRQTGKSDAAARRVIGGWRKLTSNDDAKVLVKIRQAEADQVTDVVAWVTAALKTQSEQSFLWARG